jgi:hypothetical protein
MSFMTWSLEPHTQRIEQACKDIYMHDMVCLTP